MLLFALFFLKSVKNENEGFSLPFVCRKCLQPFTRFAQGGNSLLRLVLHLKYYIVYGLSIPFDCIVSK